MEVSTAVPQMPLYRSNIPWTGGFVDLGTDLFGQLFPSMPPNSKSDMRAHLGLEILGNAASDK